MTRNTTAYQSYLNFKKVIELLEENELSSIELVEKTKLCVSTISRMVNTLVEENVIIIARLQHMRSNSTRRTRIFKVSLQQNTSSGS